MKTSQENEAQSETGLCHPLPFSEVGDSMISERGPMIRLSGQSTSLTNLLARVQSPDHLEAEDRTDSTELFFDWHTHTMADAHPFMTQRCFKILKINNMASALSVKRTHIIN